MSLHKPWRGDFNEVFNISVKVKKLGLANQIYCVKSPASSFYARTSSVRGTHQGTGKLVLSYSDKPGGKWNLGSQNSEIGLEVLIFLRISC